MHTYTQTLNIHAMSGIRTRDPGFRASEDSACLGPLGTSATEWPIAPAPGDYDDGEIGGMKIGRGNRSTRRKPAPAPLCPPQIPLDQTRVWTWTTAVRSQRLTV
jgi:hypothetical protein